jgi:hypothetical protein
VTPAQGAEPALGDGLCQNNGDYFGKNLFPIPQARKPDLNAGTRARFSMHPALPSRRLGLSPPRVDTMIE